MREAEVCRDEELALRKRWEGACEALKAKYEDEQRNLREDLVQSCVVNFLRSNACKNLNARMK